MKILANDGIAPSGKEALEKAGFTVVTEKVDQEKLVDEINEKGYEVILVRSATKVRKDIIDNCPSLKIIGRGGVGMDNIDVDYARDKGLVVINTPASSSQSVAELVMAHLFGSVRFLYHANREMPGKGNSDFGALKKAYAKGIELRGKTLGIIGFGRIGKSLASYALGCGMKVMVFNRSKESFQLSLNIEGVNDKLEITLQNNALEEVLKKSDFISLHVPATDDYLIGKDQFEIMKDGAVLINAARGGVVDEAAMLEALDSGKLSHAALDVFEGEPKPNEKVLQHPKISLSPHIGAATGEAQDRIGTELADQIIGIYRKN